tara:strand:- start:43528 stop:44292 length:765 start_codon:yes stop_codon:yes gene_type:complete
MIKIVIIGTGNLASHLFGAFLDNPLVQIVEMAGRNKRELAKFEKEVPVRSDIKKIADADIYIIAVSDGAIGEVAAQLQHKNAMVVHTSGAMPLSILSMNARRGVFYPLQTFTKGRKISFSDIPICVEAGTKKDLELLKRLGGSFSGSVSVLSSEQRSTLHLAAVFANNFTNHLYRISAQLCAKNNIPFTILLPLIRETAQKITEISPERAQTGPAVRDDGKTMEKHLSLLQNRTHKEIYSLLSGSIKETHDKEL